MDEEKKESELNTKGSGFPVSGLIRFSIVMLLIGAVSGYGFSHKWFKAVGSVSADEYSDEDWDDEYITHEGTTRVSNEEIGTIIMDGNTIHIPSKFSEISPLIEICEENQDDVAEGIDSYYYTLIDLATNGQSNGVTLRLSNDKATPIAAEDAVVSRFTIDNWGDTQADVTFYGGIKIGQSEEKLLEAIKDFTYTISEMDEFTFYSMYLGDNEQYMFIVTVENGEVTDIELDFYAV